MSHWGWNTLVLVGRFLSPGIVVLALFQTQDAIADWQDWGWWLFPLQVFCIGINLQITYVSWVRDRLR